MELKTLVATEGEAELDAKFKAWQEANPDRVARKPALTLNWDPQDRLVLALSFFHSPRGHGRDDD